MWKILTFLGEPFWRRGIHRLRLWPSTWRLLRTPTLTGVQGLLSDAFPCNTHLLMFSCLIEPSLKLGEGFLSYKMFEVEDILF